MSESHSPNPWIKHTATGLLLVLLGIIAGAFISQNNSDPDSAASNDQATSALLSKPRALQPFQLTYTGKPQFSNHDLRDKWTFLFFGYSHCPDVCPTTLSELARAYDLLEAIPDALNDTQFVFISVDPARDTPKMLATYAGYFNPAFIGVTGEPEQLTALARQMDIQFRLGTGSDDSYSVDHSSAVLLIDPQVRYYARLKAPHHAQDIRAQFLQIRQRYNALKR